MRENRTDRFNKLVKRNYNNPNDQNAKMRVCLCCKDKFPSEGIWNRRCNICEKKVEKMGKLQEEAYN